MRQGRVRFFEGESLRFPDGAEEACEVMPLLQSLSLSLSSSLTLSRFLPLSLPLPLSLARAYFDGKKVSKTCLRQVSRQQLKNFNVSFRVAKTDKTEMQKLIKLSS